MADGPYVQSECTPSGRPWRNRPEWLRCRAPGRTNPHRRATAEYHDQSHPPSPNGGCANGCWPLCRRSRNVVSKLPHLFVLRVTARESGHLEKWRCYRHADSLASYGDRNGDLGDRVEPGPLGQSHLPQGASRRSNLQSDSLSVRRRRS